LVVAAVAAKYTPAKPKTDKTFFDRLPLEADMGSSSHSFAKKATALRDDCSD
jgi:hypothetical protein